MTVLESSQITKNYLGRPALAGVDLQVGEGRIVGLFGPNGSGKTTFLKIVAGLIHPNSGSIAVCGQPVGFETKSLVSYLPDRSFLYDWMPVKEAGAVYEKFFADYNPQRFQELLVCMQLEPGLRVKSLSKGMKEKLALALTLSREARLIVLDEPLDGVDPIAREQILAAILKGFRSDSSMLVTSHLINEFETIVDEVHYLKSGRIVLSGAAEELKEQRQKSLDEIYREVFAQ